MSVTGYKVISSIDADLAVRFPKMHTVRRSSLATLSGVMLTVRSANMMELASGLPRAISTAHDRYQYVERILANDKIDADEVSLSFACELIDKLSRSGQTIVLALDQSHINETNEVLMLSVRVRDRALPVAWRVRKTQGNIGFDVQKELLAKVKAALPENVPVLLMADRFYGTPSLIGWCQKAGWGYRIRLKGNLTFEHQNAIMTTGEAVALMPGGVEQADLCCAGIKTNLGILHEKGHKEPWIIAMDTRPTRTTTMDYGLRWGIEAMFSDFKSRGFGLMQSQIRKTDRMERLILIMAIAMYWAVSTGMADENNQKEQRREEKRG